MLKLTWFEFLIRTIPEEFLFVLAIHAFSKTKVDLKRYILSGVVASIAAYLIRLLPIEYGVHSLLALIFLIVMVNFVNKIDIIKSIQSGIIAFIICFVFEGLSLSFIQFILKKDLNIVMSNSINKTLIGLPSLVFFGIVVVIYYYRFSKRKELKDV